MSAKMYMNFHNFSEKKAQAGLCVYIFFKWSTQLAYGMDMTLKSSRGNVRYFSDLRWHVKQKNFF